MDQPLNSFKPVIEAVMTNWTALKMAVELSPSPVLWKDHALDLINNVGYHFEKLGSDLDELELEDYLTESLDVNFHTICEDESPKQIAQLLVKYYCLWTSGNMDQFSKEITCIPPADFTWIHTPKNNEYRSFEENMNTHTSKQEPDEDGWITVMKKK